MSKLYLFCCILCYPFYPLCHLPSIPSSLSPLPSSLYTFLSIPSAIFPLYLPLYHLCHLPSIPFSLYPLCRHLFPSGFLFTPSAAIIALLLSSLHLLPSLCFPSELASLLCYPLDPPFCALSIVPLCDALYICFIPSAILSSVLSL